MKQLFTSYLHQQPCKVCDLQSQQIVLYSRCCDARVDGTFFKRRKLLIWRKSSQNWRPENQTLSVLFRAPVKWRLETSSIKATPVEAAYTAFEPENLFGFRNPDGAF